MEEKKKPEEMKYEEAFNELKELVNKMASDDLPLEESLALFERGQALAARCSSLLEKAELKLRELTPKEMGGYLETDLDLDSK
jgi:exodeoxyribonuclease VII small subunit